MLNKTTAMADFESWVIPWLQHQDKVAVRCAWNDYIDGLIKDGRVTEARADSWGNPYDA